MRNKPELILFHFNRFSRIFLRLYSRGALDTRGLSECWSRKDVVSLVRGHENCAITGGTALRNVLL